MYYIITELYIYIYFILSGYPTTLFLNSEILINEYSIIDKYI